MKTISTCLAALLALCLNAQTTFNKACSSTSTDYGYYSIQTSDGGYLFTGLDPSVNLGDMLVIKTDVSGNITWKKSFGTTNDTEEGLCALELNSGEYIIGGYTMPLSTGNPDAYFIKISSAGTLLFSHKFGNSTEYEWIFGITKSGD